MFKISFTFFYQFSFSQLFSLVEIALPSISLCWNSFCVCKQVVRLFLLQIICATQNIAAYFCFVLISEKTKRWKEVCGLYLSEKLGKWILTKMLWPAIQKYQSIVGYCSLETANSCNYDLMMRADQRENKVLKGSLWFISFRERRWILTKMLQPAIQKIIRGSLSRLVNCLSPLRTKALLGTVPWKRQTHAIMILWCVLIKEKTKRWKEVCGLYISEKLGKWILTKMLWPAIQKIIQGSQTLRWFSMLKTGANVVFRASNSQS